MSFFKDCYRQLHAGASTMNGLTLADGTIVGRNKADDAKWLLGESLLHMKQDDVRKAETLNLFRDERQSRLHMRYRCVNSNVTEKCGYLGQARDFAGTATGKNVATKHVFTQFCTKFADAPSHAHVEPCLDSELLNHMRNISEAISVDSAAVEVAAAKDACRSSQDSYAFLPNCKYLLYDCLHACRRILTRP